MAIWENTPNYRAVAEERYWHIRAWNTSQAADTTQLFCNKRTFNDHLSSWDTFNVTTMEGSYAHAFNGDLSRWNTSKMSILCLTCSGMLMHLMEILVDEIHPMSLLCLTCSGMLMHLMEILVDGMHPMSLLWRACSVMLMPLMEISVDGTFLMLPLWRICF